MDFLDGLWDNVGSWFTDNIFDGLGDWAADIFDFGSDAVSGAPGTIDSVLEYSPANGNWYDPSMTNSFMPGEWDWMSGGSIDTPLGNFGIPGLGQLATGGIQALYGLYAANNAKEAASKASQMQDPFGKQRAFYQNELKKLYTDPDYIKRMPGYEAAYKQGLDSVLRRNAAMGRRDSGNVQYDIMDYSNKYVNDRFDQQAKSLAELAGAQIAPSGGQFIVNGQNAADTARGAALNALIDPWKNANAQSSFLQDIANYGKNLNSNMGNL